MLMSSFSFASVCICKAPFEDELILLNRTICVTKAALKSCGGLLNNYISLFAVDNHPLVMVSNF